MKNKIIIIAVFILLIIVFVGIISIPFVQDKLIDRVITKRITNISTDLFKDDALRILLVGTSSPLPNKTRAATSVIVIAGGKYYIFDIGSRSSNNIGLWNIPSEQLGAVFLTHFHSDHISDLGEFNMMTWAQGRSAPLTVYGPPGVKQVVHGFNTSYEFDRIYRTRHHGSKYLDPEIGKMIAVEIDIMASPRTILDAEGLTIKMFVVNHEPVSPAVGYRIDYKDRSVVISGDTKSFEKMPIYAANVDVLVHEALASHFIKRVEIAARDLGNDRLASMMSDVQEYHTSTIDATNLANKAQVKELVFYHLSPGPSTRIAENIFMRGVKDIRSTGVTLGYDGLLITLPNGNDKIIKENILSYLF